MGVTRFVYYAAICAFGLSPALAAEKMSKEDRAAFAASPEDVAAKVIVINDRLDTVIRLSTLQFTRTSEGLFAKYNADKYLRAFIDKRTGETRFQLYFWTTFSGSDWVYLKGLNYETPTGPQSAETDRIDSDVSCSRYYCTYREDMVAAIPEEVLRQVSAGAKGGQGDTWSFRIFSKNAAPINTQILKTEIAGLLLAVDREVSALK